MNKQETDDELRARIKRNREAISLLFNENKNLRRRLIDRGRERIQDSIDRRKRVQSETLVKAEAHRWSSWDNADDLFLLNNAGTMTQRQLAGVLNRTFHAVNTRLKRLRKEERELDSKENGK